MDMSGPVHSCVSLVLAVISVVPQLKGADMCIPYCMKTNTIVNLTITSKPRHRHMTSRISGSNHTNDDLPMDGLPLCFLHEFICDNGGEVAFQGLSSDDVKNRFVLPYTRNTRLSMCAQMSQEGDIRIKPATWFVSHAWRYEFLDLVAALDSFFDHSTCDVVLWIDIFSVSQHETFLRSPDWWQQTFCTAIGEMGKMVMVMTPWDNPIALTRAWCLVEIFACQTSGSRFEVALPPSERERFLEEITTRSDAFYSMLSNVNTEKSECSQESDRERIFAAVRGLDQGFIGLDRCVLESITNWLVQQLEMQLQKARSDGPLDQEVELNTALADTLVRIGEYDRALPLYEESLILQSNVLGDDHPKTLSSLGGLASLLLRKGDHHRAHSLYDECFSKTIRILGYDHPNTLVNMHQMAIVLTLIGNRTEGESMFEECLTARKRVLGTLHPDTLSTMNSLALSYQYRGAYSQAQILLTACLAGRKQILGESHPDTFATMSHLGTVLLNMGFFTECEPLFLACLDGRKRILGNHPDTLSSMSNIASLFRCQKRFLEAEPLFVACLEGRKKLLGKYHAETLSSMNNLALLLDSQMRFDEAETLHLECLTHRTHALGDNHPDTLSSMNNLGLTLTSQHRHDAAEAIYRKCLHARLSTLGNFHPSTLSSMNNLANACRKQQKYDIAKPLYEKCLEGRMKTLGEHHIETLSCKINIASLLAESGNRCDESEILFRTTIREGMDRYGPAHPRLSSWKKSYKDRFGRQFVDSPDA